MSLTDLTLQEQHLEQLRELTHRDDGNEGAAYVLFGQTLITSDPWDRRSRTRYSSHEVIAIPEEDWISSSPVHVTWSTRSFIRLLKRAAKEKLVVGVVHTHPDGPARFSRQDDVNEAELFRLARNRNGAGTAMVSILLAGAGEVRARVWLVEQEPVAINPVRVIGRNLKVFDVTDGQCRQDEAFSRQALAFGPTINTRLRGLKVGIVGCGGTGSPTALLLARLGVGQIVLFDEDIVEVTNLNRLHGARRADADAMRPKVEVLAREITELALGVRVVPIQSWIGSLECRDALKSCDVIFGCTDDHDGRLMLNRLAYFYLIPVIDMGLAIQPGQQHVGMQDLSGRVTILVPGSSCLLCRGIVNPTRAREESLRRQSPEEYERRKREAYVRGGENPAPAVVTFTTATACLAIDELLQGLTNFRGEQGWSWQRVRRFDLLQDRKPGALHNPNCPVCTDMTYWGRGDIEPFLDRVG